jgi:CheY-like chemotaxis protein
MKTILLVEDELPLMKLLSTVLGRSGYAVKESTSAEEAIKRFLDANRQIDILVADVTLPESTGIQVAILLRAERPELRVILTSGYPADSWKAGDVADLKRLGAGSVIVLEKPFMPQVLLTCIRELMEAPLAAVRTA